MPKSLICSKCNGAMIEGFVPQSTINPDNSPLTWVEGEPEKQSEPVAGVGVRLPVKTFCCRKCGFLEFYAG